MQVARPTRFTADELEQLSDRGCTSTTALGDHDAACVQGGRVEVHDGAGRVLFFVFDAEGTKINARPTNRLDEALAYLDVAQ